MLCLQIRQQLQDLQAADSRAQQLEQQIVQYTKQAHDLQHQNQQLQTQLSTQNLNMQQVLQEAENLRATTKQQLREVEQQLKAEVQQHRCVNAWGMDTRHLMLKGGIPQVQAYDT